MSPPRSQSPHLLDGIRVLNLGAVGPAARAALQVGSPSLRRAMMFFWISEVPPPIVSTTV